MNIAEITSIIFISLVIFCARIADVSLSTIRIICLAKRIKLYQPLLGFFEVLVWFIALNSIFRNFSSPIYYITYAGSFVAGSLVGMVMNKKLTLATVVVRVTPVFSYSRLLNYLERERWGFIIVDGNGVQGHDKNIFIVVKRKMLKQFSEIIKRFNPHAFVSIEEVQKAQEDIFPHQKSTSLFNQLN